MCQCSPAADGSCPGGQVLVTFTLAGSTATYQECRDAMKVVNDAYTFKLCWAYSCLPAAFGASTRGFQITAARVPVPDNATPLTGSTVLASYIEPSCASMSSTIVPTETNIRSIALDSNQAVVVPETAISGVTFELTVRANCSDKFAAGILSITEAPAPQPIIPTSSCPCWDIPGEGGSCPTTQVPITLSTVETEMGVSYRQCVDPANFDVYTGRMAWSFCWRYKCLPDAFASSDFTAEVKEIDRYNIKRMPGSATFNATIQRTPGVLMNVTGKAKVAGDADMFFDVASLVTLPNGDWVSGNITLPPGGINNLTVQYYVPVGFDDLSAAVVMDAWPGPPPPNSPPAPPGTVCRCPSVPDNNQCPPDTVLTRTYITDNPSVYTYQCIPLPQYDVFTRYFAFSTCWRWACLPSEFNRKPYTLEINNITQYNIDAMPGGVSRVQWLKPTAVNMTIAAHPIDAPDTVVGPFLSLNGNNDITLPSAGMYSFDVTIAVPAWPWIDGNSGAIIISPGPSPPSPPRPPPRPPLPPAPPVASNSTVVVAEFYVLRQLSSEAELDDIIARTSADVSVRLSGYLVTLPVAFNDYNAVADCEPASRQDFITQMARSLGLGASSLTVSCRYGSTIEVARRRQLQQGTSCAGSAIQLTVAASLGTGAVTSTDTIPNLVSSANKNLEQQYGSTTCFGQHSVASKVAISQPVTGTTTATSLCSALSKSITLTRSEATSPSCSVQQAGSPTSTPSTDPNTSGNGSGSDSSSSTARSGGVIAAIVIGSVVGVAAMALIAWRVAKNRREAAFLAPPPAPPPPPPPAQSYMHHQDVVESYAGDRRIAAAAAARRGLVFPSGPPSRPGTARVVVAQSGPETVHPQAASLEDDHEDFPSDSAAHAADSAQPHYMPSSEASDENNALPMWDRTSGGTSNAGIANILNALRARPSNPGAVAPSPGSRHSSASGMAQPVDAAPAVHPRTSAPLSALLAGDHHVSPARRVSASSAWDDAPGNSNGNSGPMANINRDGEEGRAASEGPSNRPRSTSSARVSPTNSRPTSAKGVPPASPPMSHRSRLAEASNNNNIQAGVLPSVGDADQEVGSFPPRNTMRALAL